jgi:hypothetical protein
LTGLDLSHNKCPAREVVLNDLVPPRESLEDALGIGLSLVSNSGKHNIGHEPVASQELMMSQPASWRVLRLSSPRIMPSGKE